LTMITEKTTINSIPSLTIIGQLLRSRENASLPL
jgi:hypothetical protein